MTEKKEETGWVKYRQDCFGHKEGDVVEHDKDTVESLCKAGIAERTDSPESETEDKVEKALQARDDKIVETITKALRSEVKVKLPAMAKDHSDESLGDFLQCVGKASSNHNNDVRNKAHNKLREAYKTSTMSEGVNASGGYTVPVEYAKELLFVPGYDGPLFPTRLKPRPMGTKTLCLPALDQTISPSGANSAFYAGVTIGIVAEGNAPSDNTQPAFKQVVLTAKKAMATAVVSNELLDDSIISIENLIKDQFTRASNFWVNWQVLNGGGGSSALTGIIGNAATKSVARQATGKVGILDLGNMYASLTPDSRKNAVWVINPLVWAQLLTLGSTASGASNFVFIGNDAQGATGNRLFGLEVVPYESCPALGQSGDCCLIDPRYYALGMRQEMQIDSSPHYLFPSDQVVYRIKFRLDGTPQLTAPIILNDGTTTVSPFVTLGNVAS